MKIILPVKEIQDSLTDFRTVLGKLRNLLIPFLFSHATTNPSAIAFPSCSGRHCCLHIGLRTNKQFKCTNKICGWIGDADFSGAKMIELWGCSVNQPRGLRFAHATRTELLSCAIEPGLPKAPSGASRSFRRS